MKIRFWILSALAGSTIIWLGILSSCSSLPKPELAKASNPWVVFYSANRQGEIEPCGCQVHQMGGLNRLGAFLEAERKPLGERPQLFVDSGDTFFSANPLNPHRTEQEAMRADALADSFRLLKLDAFSPGERDFAEGVDFLKSLQARSGAVFISSNLRDNQGKLLFARSHLFQSHGETVGVFSLASVEAMAWVDGVNVEPPENVYPEVIQELRASGAKRIILLSHLGLETDREYAKKGGVDLIVGSHSLDSLQRPEIYDNEAPGKTAIVQTLYQGQQIGRIDLVGGSEFVRSELVDLEDTFDKPSSVASVIQKYRDEIHSRGLTAIDTVQAPLPGQTVFVANAVTCRGCHREQYEFWSKTNHAAASIVLYAKNQHFDAECIGCHSLGFEQPGGFEKIARPYVLKSTIPDKKGTSFVETVMKQVFGGKRQKPLDSRTEPARYAKLHAKYVSTIEKLEAKGDIQKWFLDVQCEHCHGVRTGHPGGSVATTKKVQESTCRSCHTAPNAPNFVSSMVAKVACPLMKR